MHLRVVEHKAPQLQQIQDFFQRQAGVVEAHVWRNGEAILARVIVEDWSLMSDTDLRTACRKRFGAPHTPRLIMIERVQGQGIRSAA